jgi:hypothetical protein
MRNGPVDKEAGSDMCKQQTSEQASRQRVSGASQVRVSVYVSLCV